MGRTTGLVEKSAQIQPYIGWAWVEYSWANAIDIGGLQYYNYLSADWTVPRNPVNKWPYNYQVLYFFPLFQSSGEIIQPVLQYGYNGSFGGSNSWSMASWSCGDTACPHSSPIGVSQGHQLHGEIYILDDSPL
jgi:hypothetical protein